MNVVIILCVVIAGVFFSRWLKSRYINRGPEPVYLMVYDGQSFVLHETERVDGSFIVDGVEYPSSSCRPLEVDAKLRIIVYVFAAEPIALTTHQQLMKHRAAIVKGHLFKSGGDMTRLVNMVAAGAVIACAIFVYMSVGSLQSSSVQQQVILEKIDKWTQSPLIIQK